MKESDYKIIDSLKQDYEAASMNEGQMHQLQEAIENGKETKRKQNKHRRFIYAGLATAAALAIVVLPNTSAKIAEATGAMPVLGKVFQALTFREYHYEDETHLADVKVDKLQAVPESGTADPVDAEKTADEINDEVDKYTKKYIRQFKADLKKKDYQALHVRSKVITKTDRYFVLKLTAVQTAADSYEASRFFTIDRHTGKRLALADLFLEGSNYMKAISENIKKQMRDQMKSDENADYWIDSKDFPEDDFKSIKADTEFYVNAKGEIVICFGQGEVAPMYMGAVEFVIPADAIRDIVKN